MFCIQCGASSQNDAQFCSKCGRAFTEQERSSPPPAQKPVTYVPNYMVWSVLSTVLCCLPFGIVAIIYSAQVDTKMRLRDYEGAKRSSARARMWAWISFAVALFLMFAYGIAVAIAISQGGKDLFK